MWSNLPELLQKIRLNMLFAENPSKQPDAVPTMPTVNKSGTKQCSLCKRRYSTDELVCHYDGHILIRVRPVNSGFEELAERYEIIAPINDESTNEVFRARRLDKNSPVAIKVLRLQGSEWNQRKQLERFARESVEFSKLTHANIPLVIESGTTKAGLPFLVSEFAEGATLTEEIASGQQTSARDLGSIFSQVCDALIYAHEMGVFHPDLKPSDIIISRSASQPDQLAVKVTGFAKGRPWIHGDNQLVQATERGDIFGDARYISPEVCLGRAMDARSNVYSIGCILYEATYGKPPFEADHYFAIALQKLHHDANFPQTTRLDGQVESKVRPLIGKALRLDPNERFQSIAELKAALLEALA